MPRTAPSPDSLRAIIRDVMGARPLMYQFMLRDLRVRYKQAVLGLAWALFMPMLIVFSGVLIRFASAQVTAATFERTTVAALTLKGLAWGFFVGAIGVATPSMTGNGNLITKVYFPREVLPLAAIGAQAFDTLVGTTLFLVLLPFLGVTITAQALWLVALVPLYVAFTLGLGMVLSCANVFFRDVKYIVQTLLTFGIFLTPVVFFDASMLGPKGSRLVMLNPLAPLLEGFRLALVEGHNLLEPLTVPVRTGLATAWEPWYLAYSGLWAAAMLVGGAFIFRRASSAFPEYV